MIHYNGLDKGSSQINLKSLEVIQFIKGQNDASSFFFFDNHQHFIPIETQGIQDVLTEIENYLKLPPNYIEKKLKEDMTNRSDIWRKKFKQNYSIESSSIQELTKGFNIKEEGFFSWNIKYEELKALASTYFSSSEYGHKILKFSQPVNIGNIQTDDLILYYDTKRKDVPCYHFYCTFYNVSNDVESYFELKNSLKASLGEPIYSHERDSGNTTQWNIDGLKISISYSHNSPYFFDRGFTSFNVFNETKQEIDFQEKEYPSLKNISDVIIFYRKVFVNSNFRRSNHVRRFPDELKEKEGKGYFWIDANKERCGFAAGDYSVILMLEQIDKFSLQNITPARGQGGSSLSVILKDKSKMGLISGECYYFDRYLKEISTLTGKEIQIEETYQDI